MEKLSDHKKKELREISKILSQCDIIFINQEKYWIVMK
jgi:hypothetical protein